MKEATSTPLIEVVCAIIRHPEDPDSCLAAQRAMQDKTLPEKWEFPGGKVEKGESEPQALAREILEELSIAVEVGEALTPVIHHYESFSIRLIPFVCAWTSGELHAHEHAATRWINRGNLHLLDWAPADLPIVLEWQEENN